MSLRLGLDPVHTTRVATRRLRSTLRVFGELFDSAAAERLDGELAWYAQLLGQGPRPSGAAGTVRRRGRVPAAGSGAGSGRRAHRGASALRAAAPPRPTDGSARHRPVPRAVGHGCLLDEPPTAHRARGRGPGRAVSPGPQSQPQGSPAAAHRTRLRRRPGAAPRPQGRQTGPLRGRTRRAAAGHEGGQSSDQTPQKGADRPRRTPGQRRRPGSAAAPRRRSQHHPGAKRLHLRTALRPQQTAARRSHAAAADLTG